MSSSETDENWEDVSTDITDNEERVEKVEKTVPLNKNAGKARPWSILEMYEEKTAKKREASEVRKTLEKHQSLSFEKEELAERFLSNLEDSDFEKNSGRILKMASFSYLQVGHDMNKPIIIELDSLLFKIFSNKLHDWRHGGESLHLTYAVERFLTKITAGKRAVEIHSFRCLEKLWANPSKLLCRKIIAHHLKTRVDVPFHEFEDWCSSEWNSRMELIDPGFVLVSGCPDLVVSSKTEFSSENGVEESGGEDENEKIEENEKTDEVKLLKGVALFGLSLFADRTPAVRIEEVFFFSNAMFGFAFQVFPVISDYLRERKHLIGKGIDSLVASVSEEKDTCQEELNTVLELIRASGINKDLVISVFGCYRAMRKFLCRDRSQEFDFVTFAKTYLVEAVTKKHFGLEKRENLEADDVLNKSCGPLSKCGEVDDFESEGNSPVLFAKTVAEELIESFDLFCDREKMLSVDLLDGRLYNKLNDLLLYRNDQNNVNNITESDFPNQIIQEVLKLWDVLVGLEGLEAIKTEKFFPLKSSLRSGTDDEGKDMNAIPKKTKENKKTVTHSLYKLDSEVVTELVKDIDDMLDQSGLIYSPSEVKETDAIDKIDPELYIKDQLEIEMMNVDKISTPRESQSAISKFYYFMKKYSESLASPKIVLRDVIVEDIEKDTKEQPKAKGGKKKKQQGKKKINDRKQLITDRNNMKKIQKAKESMLVFIDQGLRDLKLEDKIKKLDEKLLPLKDPVIALPGQIQLLEWLIELYRNSNPAKNKTPATLLFRNIYDIYRRFKRHLTLEQFEKLQMGLMVLGFIKENKKLVEDYNRLNQKALSKPISHASDIYCEPIGMSCVRFQLKHAGHFMVRSIQSKEDPRVSGFYPDDWQRMFLDAVDRNESCLVVTPTSSGKTFISYYTMKKILHENKNTERKSEKNYVVFVCPSKTLVNQVSADIYGRYGEIFGIDTLDYDRAVSECEVLITIPESFEKILLSPVFESFVKRIKYVIMDEIHSIGDPTGGEIWERIILMIQCPFIALSATLGNPSVFHHWLQRVSNIRQIRQKGERVGQNKVNLIEFYERWSDLEKYIYIPENAVKPKMALDEFEPNFQREKDLFLPINPLAAFKLRLCTLETFVIPKIDMTSKDCLEVYDAMYKMSKELDGNKPELVEKIKYLDPEKYFTSPCITKNEVTRYAKEIKSELKAWAEKGYWNEINSVLDTLSSDILERIKSLESNAEYTPESIPENEKDKREELLPLPNTENPKYDGPYSDDFLVRNFIPMLIDLRNKKDLPAIVFTRTQKLCNVMALELLKYFESNEKFVMSRGEIKDRKKNKRQHIKEVKAWKRERDRIDKRKEEEMLMEGTIPNTVVEDDDEKDLRFSFIKHGDQPDQDDIKYWLGRTLYRNKWSKKHPFLRCIERGIAVHHLGMTRAYRALVEVLFRAKHIKVVLTVGTLALGVNMPCRTTVFAGDSSELTPLRFKQMMGRAGRRGYDNIGKVIFFGIPPNKISYLMNSSLLTLHGHETMTMTTFLRNLFCIAESKDKKFRFESFKNMMKKTFSEETEQDKNQIDDQIKLFYRYSMEYLYQNELVNRKLIPVNFAGLVTALHSTEPANFVFAILLQKGIFDKICESVTVPKADAEQTIKTKEQIHVENTVSSRLLEVMGHIFFRVPLPQGFRKPSYSNSKLVLDPLEEDARQILDRFNATTVALYTQFVRLSGEIRLKTNLEGSPELLPLSKLSIDDKVDEDDSRKNEKNDKTDKKEMIEKVDSSESLKSKSLFDTLFGKSESAKARSYFVSLSGHGDKFSSGQEFADTSKVYSQEFKKSDSIPVIEMKDINGDDLLLSAYALDFFKQGSLQQVMKESNLPELFAWLQLKNWSLTLRNISRSLAHIYTTVDAKEKVHVVDETKAKTLYAFSTLSELFDNTFNKIGDLVDYNYE